MWVFFLHDESLYFGLCDCIITKTFNDRNILKRISHEIVILIHHIAVSVIVSMTSSRRVAGKVNSMGVSMQHIN